MNITNNAADIFSNAVDQDELELKQERDMSKLNFQYNLYGYLNYYKKFIRLMAIHICRTIFG